MVSLAAPKVPADGAETSNLPDLSDAVYFNQVLKLPVEKSEDHVDDELIAKARQLGLQPAVPAHNTTDKRYTSSAESASTVPTYHARTFSTASNGSADTALTAHSSVFAPSNPEKTTATQDVRRPRPLNFNQYEKYLAHIDKNLDQPKFRKSSAAPPDASSKSLFSVSTRRSLASVKSVIKNRVRWRRKSTTPYVPNMLVPPETNPNSQTNYQTRSCVCCRDDYAQNNKPTALHNLPCGHTYCAHCLRVMVSQATTDESKMPPRCCTQPIPGDTIQVILTRENQQAFLKAVVQYSTPWDQRIFCPNSDCGEFIPPRNKVDPKSPFSVTCRKCRTRACVMCKRHAHPVGKDCPEDYELDQVLKMGEKSGWRRCYKCRNLVELANGCTHMTCRCKAQFCYICGGVWDPVVGCPNVCSGEEELERRRLEEEERLAELEAQKLAEEAAAEEEAAKLAEARARSSNHQSFRTLQHTQQDEFQRFLDFETSVKSKMQSKHEEQKGVLIERQKDQEEKMKDRHTKTAAHLEDRQVAAEMELRASLDQGEKSVRIRLKHMEAYCDGLGRNPSAGMPHRTVTERDLRELGQQYNLRDNMERLNQSKINVMRDRQAKRMEELQERQDTEMDKLRAKSQEEIEDLAAQFAHEADAVSTLFDARRERLQKRWELSMEVLCRELESKESIKYAQLPTPEWPQEEKKSAVETTTD